MKTPQVAPMAGMSPLGLKQEEPVQFKIQLIPCTLSALIRDMNRQTQIIEAKDLREAKQITARAFPDGADLSGEWFVETVVPLNPRNVDEKTVVERKWTAPLKPKAEQKACDAGLFSDDSKQTELF